jgi:hypothetical protein
MMRHMNSERLKRSFRISIMALLCALMLEVVCWGQCTKDGQNCPKSAPVESPTSPFTGCYQLTLGRYWPWAFGEDTKYVTPPSRIQLLSERGSEGFEQNGFLLRAIPTNKRTTYVRGEPSYWRVESTDQIDLVWTDGFTGVTLKLEKKGYELRGWAHPHFDAVKLIPRTARVVARPIACDAP